MYRIAILLAVLGSPKLTCNRTPCALDKHNTFLIMSTILLICYVEKHNIYIYVSFYHIIVILITRFPVLKDSVRPATFLLAFLQIPRSLHFRHQS